MQKNSWTQMLQQSAREFKNTGSLAIGGLLIALNVVLGFFGQFKVSDVLEIRFDFLSIAIAGMLLGPVMGAAVGGLSDIARTILKGGNFFIGFTINQIILGFLFGMLLYHKFYANNDTGKLIFRVITLNIVMNLGLNLFITTYWLHIMYGSSYTVLLGTRFLKEAVTLPINSFLSYIVLAGVYQAHKRVRKIQS